MYILSGIWALDVGVIQKLEHRRLRQPVSGELFVVHIVEYERCNYYV